MLRRNIELRKVLNVVLFLSTLLFIGSLGRVYAQQVQIPCADGTKVNDPSECTRNGSYPVSTPGVTIVDTPASPTTPTTPTTTPSTTTIPAGCPGGAAGPKAPGATCPQPAGAGIPKSIDASPTPGNCDGSCNEIEKDLQLLINFLTVGVGVVVTIMIVLGGLQYILAQDNPKAVQAARSKIINAVVAMISLVFVWAFLQWIVPGGVFK